MTSNYVPACREPMLTHTTDFMSGCDMDLLGACKLPSNEVQCQSYSEMKQLCVSKPVQQIIADGQVHHWCGSKDPSTVQLLRDTTTVLQ